MVFRLPQSRSTSTAWWSIHRFPMIPLFTLAGYLLAEGGAPRRLIRIFNALFGGIRGGAALVSVLACVFFTSFTGASGVTIIALGGVLMPLLVAAGYSEKNALGLLAGAGSAWAACCLPGCRWSFTQSWRALRSTRCSLRGWCPAC